MTIGGSEQGCLRVYAADTEADRSHDEALLDKSDGGNEECKEHVYLYR